MLHLVRAADHRDHVATGGLPERDERRAHAASRRVNEDPHALPEAAQLEERVPGGQAHRGKPRRLGDREALRQGKHLVLRHDQVRRVSAEAGDRHDARAVARRARDLEAGRDRPADVLLGRRVEAHPDDAVGVVDADCLDLHELLARSE
jgi:hypothetical protein